MVLKGDNMRISAQQEIADHLAAMLEKSGFVRETVEVVADCLECKGEGITQRGTELAVCGTCKGQRMVVKTVNKY